MLYTKLKKREEEIKALTKLGVISTTVIRNIEIFEKFQEHPQLCKVCRYEVIAEAYGLKNSVSVKKIIEKLKATA